MSTWVRVGVASAGMLIGADARAEDAAATRKVLGTAHCALFEAGARYIADLKGYVAKLVKSPMSEDYVESISVLQSRINDVGARLQSVKDEMVAAKVGTLSCKEPKLKQLLYCQRVWLGLGPVTADGACDSDPDLALLRYRGAGTASTLRDE